jgi:hypothetical protein
MSVWTCSVYPATSTGSRIWYLYGARGFGVLRKVGQEGFWQTSETLFVWNFPAEGWSIDRGLGVSIL